MRKKLRLLLVFALALTMLFGTCVTVSASITQNEAYEHLREAVGTGSATVSLSNPYAPSLQASGGDFASNQYKMSDGGFLLYSEITGYPDNNNGFCIPAQLEKLTGKAKQDFLKDELTIANALVWETDAGTDIGVQQYGVTTETVDIMLRSLQDNAGMGSQLLATLLSETKPDYATANKIYKPFSGVIGTIIALLAILVMALLGVTMAMDIAYITIPAFQMACGAGEGGGGGGPQGGGKKSGVGAFISKEAIKAVEAADKGEGGQAGSGEYRAAVGIYLKYRWKGLTLLGLCLLYLVQGQIYNFVAWFIDLFSGFLGF